MTVPVVASFRLRAQYVKYNGIRQPAVETSHTKALQEILKMGETIYFYWAIDSVTLQPIICNANIVSEASMLYQELSQTIPSKTIGHY